MRTQVLFDIGVLDHSEPFTRLVHQGMILGTDGEKMSKSRGNVINPDDVVNEHGAVRKLLFFFTIQQNSLFLLFFPPTFSSIPNFLQLSIFITASPARSVFFFLLFLHHLFYLPPNICILQDALRLYEMFMGPLEAVKPWQTNQLSGVVRFRCVS